MWQRISSRVAAADVVVVEQALRNLGTYPLLLKQRWARLAGTSPRVALWGHGRTYTKPVSRLETAAKGVVTREASWFFAYTEGGAAHLADRGYPRERITVLHNSVDTLSLTRTRELAETPGTPEHAEAAALRERHRLRRGRTALFLGGLDASKRIPFLLDCVRRVTEILPDFRLVVAGDGTDRLLVDTAASSPGSAVVPLGHTTGRQAALLGAVSDIMLMPGRVGLCAVDSFALRTPIVTTAWPWHAPEFEYLRNGENAVVTPDDPASYANAVRALLENPVQLHVLQANCGESAETYSIDAMAARFCEGLLSIPAPRRMGRLRG